MINLCYNVLMQQKAFTLIELLVVIAIIGLIASIVLVNMSGQREKAIIARSLSFNQQIQHVFALESIGGYNFENNLNDNFSEHKNSGSYKPSGSPVYGNSVHQSLGKAINLDGSHYVEIPPSFSTAVPGVISFTISAWIKPYNLPPNRSTIVFKEEQFQLSYTITGKIDFDVWSDGYGWSIGSKDYCLPDKWCHVVVTFRVIEPGLCKAGIYVNGIGDASTANNEFGTNIFFDSPIFIGGCASCLSNFNGLIDEVYIYYNTTLF